MGSQSKAVKTSPGYNMTGLNGFALHRLQSEDREIEQHEVLDSLKSDSLKDEILGLSNYSSRLERVLLALMRQQSKDRERLEGLSLALVKEKEERERGKEDAEEERAKDREAVAALERQLEDRLEGVRSELKVGLDEAGRGLEGLEDRLTGELSRLDEGVQGLGQKCDEETKARNALGKQIAEELENVKTEFEKDLERSRDELKGQIEEGKGDFDDKIVQMQDKLLERLYDEEDKRTKETEALKNGLDEEKMLRGQEQDRVRKVLADTVESLGNEVASQVEAMNKL